MADSLLPAFQASSPIERFLYFINFPAILIWIFTRSSDHRIEQLVGQSGSRHILIDKFGRAKEVWAFHYWLSVQGLYWMPAMLFLGLIAVIRARRRAERR